MATTPEVSKDSVIILYKGGRLPTWHGLTPEARDAYQQEHVDLMLSVAREHGLMRLEGFKLMAPQQSWERFWVIEFPTLTGAEAWIDAEMAPPYGRYGYYEYYTARHWGRDHFSQWAIRTPETGGAGRDRSASRPSASRRQGERGCPAFRALETRGERGDTGGGG